MEEVTCNKVHLWNLFFFFFFPPSLNCNKTKSETKATKPKCPLRLSYIETQYCPLG